MSTHNGDAQPAAEQTAASKPKRVRTGCLTCRERHLKCDEALPNCMNCRKSARICKRGVRLNFIDTQCQEPPVIPSTTEWNIGFVDESRDIASEYKGGLNRYAYIDTSISEMDNSMSFDYNTSIPVAPTMSHQPLPSIQGMLPGAPPEEAQPSVNYFDQAKDPNQIHAMSNSTNHSQTNMQHQPQPHNMAPYERVMSPPLQDQAEVKEILNSQDETLFMQVFVEEVGAWMDSMDSMKHFSRLLPFHALGQPMLLNASLACGCRHLTLVNPAVYKEEKALNYYDVASRYLLRALENPERDSVICATTAVILNVYEIMTEKALPRMNHIAGARALIKECGWDARSTGIGAACFWLNVGMELLSNIRFNWQASWHPDAWGVDLDFTPETEWGREEIWTHRVVYITAKVSDFRATISGMQDQSPQNEQYRRQKRLEEWMHLRGMLDAWNANIPRTMHPLAYLYPYQTSMKSAFPEIWLLKRTTVVARLFYHTAMCLLAQINPILPKESPEMYELEQAHAHQICGITAHTKDRGVASVALRSLAIAAECLTIRREQEEVLKIFARIHKDTGWRIGFIPKDLGEKWGWNPEASPYLPTHAQPHAGHSNLPVKYAGVNPDGSPSLSTQSQTPGQQYQYDQYGDMQRMLQQQQAQQAQRHASMSQQQASPLGMQSTVLVTPQTQKVSQGPKPNAAASTPPQKAPPQGIVNPMFAAADFGMPKHPYQEYYVAPTHQYHQHAAGGQGGLGLGLYQGSGYPGGGPQY